VPGQPWRSSGGVSKNLDHHVPHQEEGSALQGDAWSALSHPDVSREVSPTPRVEPPERQRRRRARPPGQPPPSISSSREFSWTASSSSSSSWSPGCFDPERSRPHLHAVGDLHQRDLLVDG